MSAPAPVGRWRNALRTARRACAPMSRSTRGSDCAAPNYDTDHAGQICRIFELACEFGVEIDMHLDSGNTPEAMDIHLVCELTEQYGLGGHVAVGHMTKMSALPLD